MSVTPGGAQRGSRRGDAVYCGIGVCQACVVGGVRTCLQAPAARLVVIGAGPAGLSAALAAARAGTTTLVIDRAARPGGARRPERLVRRALAEPRISWKLGVDVWRAEPSRTLHLTDGTVLRPESIVLATGAYDRVLPFPGWELPGVMTVGGAQAQLKSGRLEPGRILVAGRGPLLQVAAVGLAAAGHEVAGVADAVPASAWLRQLPTILRFPARLAQAALLRARLVRHRVPLLTATLDSVEPVEDGLRATLLSGDRTWTVDVDTVAVGDGFTPQVELAVALGASVVTDPRDGSAVVSCDDDGRTTAAGVYVAGEATGIAGAASAAVTGALAGLAASRILNGNRRHSNGFYSRSARLRRRAAAERRFADALHAVTAPPAGWTASCADATILCRCERVTFGAARSAIAALGADDLRALKLVTRVGMGPCQGRLCGQAAADLLGEDPGFFAHRPVVVPVPLTSFLEDS